MASTAFANISVIPDLSVLYRRDIKIPKITAVCTLGLLILKFVFEKCATKEQTDKYSDLVNISLGSVLCLTVASVAAIAAEYLLPGSAYR